MTQRERIHREEEGGIEKESDRWGGGGRSAEKLGLGVNFSFN